MKRFIFLAFCLIAGLAGVVYADGKGRLPQTTDGKDMQKFRGIPSSIRNDTITGTKAFKNISTAGYRALKVSCTNNAGVNAACRYSYNGSTKMLPITSGGTIIYLDSTVYVSGGFVTMGNYSSATPSTVYCDSERM